jgi:hypothetical protein
MMGCAITYKPAGLGAFRAFSRATRARERVPVGETLALRQANATLRA